MCLIMVGVGLRPDFPLILAANRDEFFARPTEPAHFWPDAPGLLAGRDGEQGGTWLGVTRSGRIAAVTNFRDGTRRRSGTRSRGWLVRDYLVSAASAEAYLEGVRRMRGDYDGFNLIVGARDQLIHYSNESDEATVLGPGVHGVSNHLLNTPWPKVERARTRLAALAQAPAAALNDALFQLLADDAQAPDDELPATGVSLDWERVLSSAFIRTPKYGTRSSTTVLIDGAGLVRFEERSFAAGHDRVGQRVERFATEAA